MKGLVLFLSFTLSGFAVAAPDEQLLGKGAGYPVCPIHGSPPRQECLVGALSHYDQLYPARVVKAGTPRPLKRAEREPPLVSRTRDGATKTLDEVLATNRNTGLLVMKGDLILAERYQYDRTERSRFQSFSMAKTVVAMLVGIALHEGKIRSIDDLAQDYVPELKGHPYGETSLRHLLTMSSGMRFAENYDGRDDIARLGAASVGQRGPGGVATVAMFTDREAPAGQRFRYSSADSQVLGLVLRAAVKQPLAEYLSEKIWKPMGAEADATWQIDAGGYETGYMGINATLRDWGRFGLLLANDGAVDGRQVVPAQWVKAATTSEAPHLRFGVAMPSIGYGYQTWIIHPRQRLFAALGVRGQAVFVDPASKLVVVHTAVHEESRGTNSRADQFGLFYGTLYSLSKHVSNP